MDDKESSDRLADLESRIQEYEGEISELENENDKLKKTVKKQQDMLEELKYKNERSNNETEKKVTEDFVKDISVVRESLVKAIESAGESCQIEEGLQSTLDRIDKRLSNRGVKILDPDEGNHFNADLHEIVETVENDEYEDDRIVNVQKPGFIYDGSVIEYAKVSVSTFEE